MKSARSSISRVASLKAPSSRSNSGTDWRLTKNPRTMASSSSKRSAVREGGGFILFWPDTRNAGRHSIEDRAATPQPTLRPPVLCWLYCGLRMRRRSRSMSVGELCNRDVIVVGKRQHSAAVRLLREHHVGVLVVCEQQAGVAVPVGVVTDRNLVIEVIAEDVALDAVMWATS